MGLIFYFSLSIYIYKILGDKSNMVEIKNKYKIKNALP